jgi:histone H3/H4
MASAEIDGITRPAITRLSRKAGVKSVSDDCFPVIKNVINDRLHSLVEAALVVNSEHQTKTLMPGDVYEALRLRGYNVAQSTELGTGTGSK